MATGPASTRLAPIHRMDPLAVASPRRMRTDSVTPDPMYADCTSAISRASSPAGRCGGRFSNRTR